MVETDIAVIGGSGLERMPGVTVLDSREVTTPFGPPSAPIVHLAAGGRSFRFISRHGRAHDIAPHRVNYRANIWALEQARARRVIAVNAVGVIPPEPPLGSLAVPDQVIDYSWGRAGTFFDGESAPLEHVDFTEPYDAALRAALLAHCASLEIPCRDGGIHGVTQGPRLETRAEVDRLARDGVDYVGMTGMPEAVLAREVGLEYACLAVLVNRAAGRGVAEIHADLQQNLSRGAEAASRVVLALIAAEANDGAER